MYIRMYVCMYVCVCMCTSFCNLICRYFNQLRRHNYVTPTSYLELILTFKKLVQAKRTEIQTLQQRYLTGLEKLEFAASQVELRGHSAPCRHFSHYL